MRPGLRLQIVALVIVWVSIAGLVLAIVLMAHHDTSLGLLVFVIVIVAVALPGTLLFRKGVAQTAASRRGGRPD